MKKKTTQHNALPYTMKITFGIDTPVFSAVLRGTTDNDTSLFTIAGALLESPNVDEVEISYNVKAVLKKDN